MSSPLTLRAIVSPVAIFRLILGWGTYALLQFTHSLWQGALATPVLVLLLVVIVAVVIVCAFGVVAQAEGLAHRLGDPYGTLVLTLSILLIEVILISAVMLGPGEHLTIARDSIMAVAMIILCLVTGVAVIVGSSRHRELRPHRTGASIYLSLLVVLIAVAFALPGLIGTDGVYSPAQAIIVIVLTVALYVFFLIRQMGAQRADFQEVAVGDSLAPARSSIAEVVREHRTELVARMILLVATVTPIVLLSHDMAALLDEGLARLGAPIAVSGIIIALIVFLPETITTIRAAALGEMQRVSNLCHGALVSTVGLTLPTVLAIGLITGQTVVLAESPANLLLLAVSLALTAVTLLAARVTVVHGVALVAVFVLYGLTVFS